MLGKETYRRYVPRLLARVFRQRRVDLAAPSGAMDDVDDVSLPAAAAPALPRDAAMGGAAAAAPSVDAADDEAAAAPSVDEADDAVDADAHRAVRADTFSRPLEDALDLVSAALVAHWLPADERRGWARAAQLGLSSDAGLLEAHEAVHELGVPDSDVVKVAAAFALDTSIVEQGWPALVEDVCARPDTDALHYAGHQVLLGTWRAWSARNCPPPRTETNEWRRSGHCGPRQNLHTGFWV